MPTRELAEQVTNHLKGLTAYCEKEVLVANVAGGASTQLQSSVQPARLPPQQLAFRAYLLYCLRPPSLLMSDRPDIVIATPSRALSLLQSKVSLSPSALLRRPSSS